MSFLSFIFLTLQRKCKPNTTELVLIAEAMPFVCKITFFSQRSQEGTKMTVTYLQETIVESQTLTKNTFMDY